MAQDSSRPDFWDTRWRGGVTPWDAGGVPPMLAAWLAREPVPLRVLVPGCGSGYEVRAFAEAGHEVLGIDFSPPAIEAARAVLGPRAGRVRQGDFFAFEGEAGGFDLVYERALLCALPRRAWDDWARRMAALVRPGGRLAGFFFLDDNERGPPFGTDLARLDALRGEAFGRVEDAPVPPAQSLAPFAGKEQWQVWRRR